MTNNPNIGRYRENARRLQGIGKTLLFSGIVVLAEAKLQAFGLPANAEVGVVTSLLGALATHEGLEIEEALQQ